MTSSRSSPMAGKIADHFAEYEKRSSDELYTKFDKQRNQQRSIATTLVLLLSTSSSMNLKSAAVAAAATCTNTDNNNMPRFRSVRRIMEKPYKHWVGDGKSAIYQSCCSLDSPLWTGSQSQIYFRFPRFSGLCRSGL